MMKRLKKAFTITELVIVIAVIAILAAVLIPTFSHVVENANQSAALQTCRNALTEYQTMVTTDDDTKNDDITGATFVYNGYAFVYINSQLHYLGKVNSLPMIKNGSTAFENVKDNKLGGDNGITFAATIGDTISVSGDFTDSPKTFTLAKLAEVTKEQVEADTTGTLVAHKAENLYFYSITINNTTYNGYFTYEADENPELQLNGATYSRNAFIAGKPISVA